MNPFNVPNCGLYLFISTPRAKKKSFQVNADAATSATLSLSTYTVSSAIVL